MYIDLLERSGLLRCHHVVYYLEMYANVSAVLQFQRKSVIFRNIMIKYVSLSFLGEKFASTSPFLDVPVIVIDENATAEWEATGINDFCS